MNGRTTFCKLDTAGGISYKKAILDDHVMPLRVNF